MNVNFKLQKKKVIVSKVLFSYIKQKLGSLFQMPKFKRIFMETTRKNYSDNLSHF